MPREIPWKVEVCFATESGGVEREPDFELTEVRTGVRSAADPSTAAAPAEFQNCAEGMLTRSALFDTNEEPLWLALRVTYDGAQLVEDGLLASLQNAEVDIHQTSGWNPSDTVVITEEGRLILALQARAFLRTEIGPLRAKDAGADDHETDSTCGSYTTHSIELTGDDEPVTIRNGESAVIRAAGEEIEAKNIFSLEYDWEDCSDGPFPENQVSWVAVKGSL
jgi:hypothetical protein